MSEQSSNTPVQNKLMVLFESEVSTLLDAEEQVVHALPAMIKAADSQALKETLSHHLQATRQQIRRLEQICNHIGLRERGDACQAMEGLIEDCHDAILEYPTSALRDASLIAKAQCIEHYEISVYATLKAFAHQLGLKDCLPLLHQSQEEKILINRKFSKVAESCIQEANNTFS